ncbi:MAG: tetratricopeptide repeat protein [Bacteroidia bacterium]|nr:tetratricopeptide repeat protein [Bacteroidia bacterium]MDW8347646.1 tetratricopeptide repeat protein [Bacteroidia bacterium]
MFMSDEKLTTSEERKNTIKVQQKTSLEDKQIEEIVSKAPSAEQFLIQNKKKILYGLGIVVLVTGIVIGYLYLFGGDENEANEKAAKANMYFSQNIAESAPKDSTALDKAIKGDGQNKGLEYIAKEYSNTKVGQLANYELGMIYYRKGNKDLALKYLEKYSPGKNILAITTYGTMAAIYEDKLNKEKAAEYYKKAAEVYPLSNLSPAYLMQAGRVYEQIKKYDEALACYQKIKNEYPDSQEAKEVEKNIALVKYSR